LQRQKRKEYKQAYKEILLKTEDMSKWEQKDREEYFKLINEVAD
jgi:hypothetical protein